MNISVPHSTPKQGLNATRQASRESGGSQEFLQPQEASLEERKTCPKCGGSSFLTGAGRKPGEMSLKCCKCKAFVGYWDVKKLLQLQKLRRKKELTECLASLPKGLADDEIALLLSLAGDVEQMRRGDANV